MKKNFFTGKRKTQYINLTVINADTKSIKLNQKTFENQDRI